MKEYILKYQEREEYYYGHEEKNELIRCKDCKYFYKTGLSEPNHVYCALWSRQDTKKPTKNDFCSWAERKEE